MEDLEAKLLSSRRVREFLKHFSETQWTRVVKASVIMGIQELERSHPVEKLSAKDIEDIVGKCISPIDYILFPSKKDVKFEICANFEKANTPSNFDSNQ